MCGWCRDRFGVAWQVVPASLDRMMAEGTPSQLARLMESLSAMRRLDIATLEAAFAG
jgi:predicted 3-demethylubiquinone-9 3-methyltransferase (glyoxalase superfamily)